MLKRFRQNQPDPIDIEIAAVAEEMQTYGPDDPKYATMLAYMERLYKVKAEDRQPRVSNDTKATIVGQLAGILLVVAFERSNVWTSKALDLVRRKN